VTHLANAQVLAAGLHSLPALSKPFAATQAAWRFLNNENVTLPILAGPLVQCARDDIPGACDQWLLVVMDWTLLNFTLHVEKANRIKLASVGALGYKLFTALAVSDRDGSPLAPLCLELHAANGVHGTRAATPLKTSSVLDGLAPVMAHVHDAKLGKKPVFIIDREADSVGHYRNWSREGRQFLIRADDDRRVLHDGKERLLINVIKRLKKGNKFSESRTVDFEGTPATQFTAETIVVLHRPARTHRKNPHTGKITRRNIRGTHLPLRLVISEIRNAKGKVLARWLLMTNLPEEVKAATIALWYFWRWRIEGYHKLLKGAGQQVECWQQETPEAFARRLTVAAMACVVVWRLARDNSPRAAETRDFLIQLSGRQMKRGKNRPGFTEPALLAGLGILMPMMLILEQYHPDELRRLTTELLPLIRSEATTPGP
jgi:Transposase DDE domain